MADEEEKKDKSKDESKDIDASPGKGKAIIGWVITFTVAAICAGGGYGLSGLFAKVTPEKVVEVPDSEKSIEELYGPEDPESAKPWNFELKPITSNLSEAGSTRMIQVTVVLEISADMDETKGREYLEGKKLHLRDWLGTHLASLNLEQVAGGPSQNRMKAEIKESFNEILFPDSKPLVGRVMLKDYIIQ
jgi:flagellar basal body-associated protein FliL